MTIPSSTLASLILIQIFSLISEKWIDLHIYNLTVDLKFYHVSLKKLSGGRGGGGIFAKTDQSYYNSIILLGYFAIVAHMLCSALGEISWNPRTVQNISQ